MESGELITAMEAVRRVLILENPERPGTSSPSFTSRLVSQPEHRQRVKTVSVVIGRTLTLLQEVPAELRADFPHRGNGVVEKVRYEAPKDQLPGRVWINATQSFEGIEPETWTFLVGGYQVCEKWLKDRKGRSLKLDDIEHYQNIVAVLTRTRALMTAIDNLANDTLWPSEAQATSSSASGIQTL